MALDPLEEAQDMTTVTPSYRRNGKLFSCEPCRRGKLRCDHATPVCGRCARRNKAEQCFYHPAPLTKARTSPGPQRPSLPSSRVSISSNSPLVGEKRRNGLISPPASSETSLQSVDFPAFRSVNSQDQSIPQSPVPTSAISSATYDDDRFLSSSATYTSLESAHMSFRDSKRGFLGPTSYNAVFSENPGSLAVITEADSDDHSNLPPITAEKIRQGAEVLSILRDMPTYQKFTQRWFDLAEGMVIAQPTFRIWIEELWAEFGSILQGGRQEDLLSLSELVWRNTRKPVKVHGQMTATEWSKSFSGRDLRWEVVGSLLSVIGLIAMNLSHEDAIFDAIGERFGDRATFSERMQKAAGFCLCFCYESEILNEVYICFMMEDSVLLACMKGDAHYNSWQRTGEVCDAVVAMGLHQGSQVDAETPFFLTEFRKRIFAAAYGHDKAVSTFLGRPPRLSFRYCKMQPPLDLSDDQVFMEGAELEAALSTLDPNGWNTGGILSRATWTRIWFQNSRIREDILEIALGSGDEDVSFQVEHIRVRMEQLSSNYPAFMRVSPEEVLTEIPVPLGNTYLAKTEKLQRRVNAIFTLCVHIGIVHTEFLLQRALVNRKRTMTKELIPISRRLLQLVLLAQSKRDFLRDFQGDLVSMMAVDGLPAAGVLAIELLKQEQSRAFTPDILPRSETIQDLSVFISALGTVGSNEGNFSICNQGRRALKKVLDQILSPNQPVMPGSSEFSENYDMSLGFPTANDADFLQWLENFEWDKNMIPSASQEAS